MKDYFDITMTSPDLKYYLMTASDQSEIYFSLLLAVVARSSLVFCFGERRSKFQRKGARKANGRRTTSERHGSYNYS